MENGTRKRAPLSDVQNVPNEARTLSSVGARKPGIKRTTSMISKPSDTNKRVGEKKSLLQPPATRKQTRTNKRLPMAHTRPGGRVSEDPIPRRLTTKPKHGVSSKVLRHQPGVDAPPCDDERRREQATLKFTSSLTSRNVPANRCVPQSNGSQNNELVELLSRALHNSMNKENGGPALSASESDILISRLDKIDQKVDMMNDQTGQQTLNSTEITDLLSKLEAAQSKINEHAEELMNEKLKCARLEGELNMSKQSHQTLEKEKADMSDSLETARETVIKLQTDVESAKREKTESDTRQAQHEADAKRLNDMLEQATKKARDEEQRLSQLSQQNSDLSNQNTMNEKEIWELHQTCDELKSNVESLNTAKTQVEQELQMQLSRTSTLQADQAQHQEALDNCKKQADSECKKIKVEYDQKINALEVDRQTLSEKNNRLATENKCLVTELEQMKHAISVQTSHLSSLTSEKVSADLRIESLESSLKDVKIELESEKNRGLNLENEIAVLEEQARKDAVERRRLHNEVQELKGNIRVFCRVRPLLKPELDSAQVQLSQSMFEYNDVEQKIVACHPMMKDDNSSTLSGTLQRHPFKFDKVFAPKASQDAVFEEISQLVQSALDGYRVCIFAYGQTGSGKTHTMLGERGADDSKLGMIPRSVRQIFESAKSLEKDGWKFDLIASFMEIYNETLKDLMVDSERTEKKQKDESTNLKISRDQDSGLNKVTNLTEVSVVSEEHVQVLIDKAIRNRATAATKANDRSSRSHSVFRLHIRGKNTISGEKLHGLLNLIDLAGSERLAQSKAEGERLVETRNINKSLSALGTVIASLSNGDKHIPFRNSKLTYLLQDSLGGDSKTLMFVNVSHAMESFNESLCSLRFAAKVNNCHVGTAKRAAKVEL